MNSETRTAHGLADPSRQGRSRAWSSYQQSKRSCRSWWGWRDVSSTVRTLASEWHRRAVRARGYRVAMTGVARPRGPLPARVYWTRRLLLVAVAFALVFGLAHLLGGSTSGGNGSAPRP